MKSSFDLIKAFGGLFDSQVDARLAREVVPRLYSCSTNFDCILSLIRSEPSS